MTERNAARRWAVYCSTMLPLLGYVGVTVAVLAAAWICHALFVPRLRAGRASSGIASLITLAVLLVTPTVAAAVAAAVAVDRGVVGAPLFFYLGYAVGLVCFIVLNRKYRRFGEDGGR
ncbi:MAG TPA: hypothetical protein VF210_06945 [Pseudomonadales bacterium]